MESTRQSSRLTSISEEPEASSDASGAGSTGNIDNSGASTSTPPTGGGRGGRDDTPTSTPTIIGSACESGRVEEGEDEDDVGNVVVGRSLRDRIPSVSDVLHEVKKDYGIQFLFANSVHLRGQAEQDIIYDSPLWDEVSEKMFEAIQRYTPTDERDLKKKQERYEARKLRIIKSFIARYDIKFDDGGGDGCGGGNGERGVQQSTSAANHHDEEEKSIDSEEDLWEDLSDVSGDEAEEDVRLEDGSGGRDIVDGDEMEVGKDTTVRNDAGEGGAGAGDGSGSGEEKATEDKETSYTFEYTEAKASGEIRVTLSPQ